MILTSQLSIRMRLLLAILVPVVLTAMVSGAVSVSEIRSNGDAELQRLQQGLLEARKEGLKDVVEAARSIVEAASQNRSLNESEAKEEALRRLRAINFGDNNYVFAYDRSFRTLADRSNPNSEGVIISDPGTQDFLRELFKAGKTGKPVFYDWINLASGSVEPKMAYTIIVGKWDWMLGAVNH